MDRDESLTNSASLLACARTICGNFGKDFGDKVSRSRRPMPWDIPSVNLEKQRAVHPSTMYTNHINHPLEESEELESMIMGTDLIYIIEKCSPPLTQLGCNTSELYIFWHSSLISLEIQGKCAQARQ